MKQVSFLSFEWNSDGVMDNKTGEGDKDEMTLGEGGTRLNNEVNTRG